MNDFQQQTNRLNEYVQLLSANQRKIYAYILSLVANFSDADDILQETSRFLWEKFDQYESGTDFLAWARAVAFYRVKEFRRRNARDRIVLFDDQTIEEIQIDSQSQSDIQITDHYLSLLRDCLRKVARPDLDLIQLKYFQNIKIREIAERIGRKTQSVYRSLARIQNQLQQCIDRQVSAEERI